MFLICQQRFFIKRFLTFFICS